MTALSFSKNKLLKLQIQQLQHAEGLSLPAYETPLAAGMDLRAANVEDVVIEPAARTLVPTGLIMAIPEGYEGQVRPRSGLALKHGLTVLNAPGTIDADYRGEVKVLLINLGNENVTIKRGDRIAQLVIAPVMQMEIESISELNETKRGAGGFGSTGV